MDQATATAATIAVAATNTAAAAACPVELNPGERYAGAIVNADGTLSHHVVLLPGDVSLKWQAAKDWAAAAGGELPTRREQSLLFANAKDAFERDWYWSGETYEGAGAYAGTQIFSDGGQGFFHTSYVARVCAVRRVTA